MTNSYVSSQQTRIMKTKTRVNTPGLSSQEAKANRQFSAVWRQVGSGSNHTDSSVSIITIITATQTQRTQTPFPTNLVDEVIVSRKPRDSHFATRQRFRERPVLLQAVSDGRLHPVRRDNKLRRQLGSLAVGGVLERKRGTLSPTPGFRFEPLCGGALDTEADGDGVGVFFPGLLKEAAGEAIPRNDLVNRKCSPQTVHPDEICTTHNNTAGDGMCEYTYVDGMRLLFVDLPPKNTGERSLGTVSGVPAADERCRHLISPLTRISVSQPQLHGARVRCRAAKPAKPKEKNPTSHLRRVFALRIHLLGSFWRLRVPIPSTLAPFIEVQDRRSRIMGGANGRQTKGRGELKKAARSKLKRLEMGVSYNRDAGRG